MFGSQPTAQKLDFDLHDDLMFFMNNDPEFYRQDYYPFLHKFRNHCNAGRSVTPKAFGGMVKLAYETYKNKFQIPELQETLDERELEEICEKLQALELKHFHDEKRKKQEMKNETKTTI